MEVYYEVEVKVYYTKHIVKPPFNLNRAVNFTLVYKNNHLLLDNIIKQSVDKYMKRKFGKYTFYTVKGIEILETIEIIKFNTKYSKGEFRNNISKVANLGVYTINQ